MPYLSSANGQFFSAVTIYRPEIQPKNNAHVESWDIEVLLTGTFTTKTPDKRRSLITFNFQFLLISAEIVSVLQNCKYV